MEKSTIEAFKNDNDQSDEVPNVTVGLKSGTECKGSITIEDGYLIIDLGGKVTYVSFEDIESLTGTPIPRVDHRR